MDELHTYDYLPPVNQLLALGEGENIWSSVWPDYLKLGIGQEQIPELIRLALDDEIDRLDPKEHRECWGPQHAWRTLGQLRAEAAIEPLIEHLNAFRENDCAMEEVPIVLGMIGPKALPPLTAYIADHSHDENARCLAIDAILYIALNFPETRSDCIAIFSKQLELLAEEEYSANAYLIDALVKLKATEAAPLIEQALAADIVETFITGDWDTIQAKLGLISEEEAQERKEMRAKERKEERGRSAGASVAALHSYEATPSANYFKIHPDNKQTHKKAKNKVSKIASKKNHKKK